MDHSQVSLKLYQNRRHCTILLPMQAIKGKYFSLALQSYNKLVILMMLELGFQIAITQLGSMEKSEALPFNSSNKTLKESILSLHKVSLYYYEKPQL